MAPWGQDEHPEHVPGIEMEPKLDRCPHCGGDTYHIRLKVTGTIREHHAFDGRKVDNTGMWDSTHTTERRTVYCSDCDRPIAKVVK